MQIYPAIDLYRGRVVRLYKGDYNQVTDYGVDPVELAQDYAQQGAGCIHVVDLDGARSGDFTNLKTIEQMAAAIDIPVQSGGGIRARADLDRLRDAGVGRAVIGSLAIKQPELVGGWLSELGEESICLAMDARANDAGDFMLSATGWTETGTTSLWDGLLAYQALPLKHVLCTDIGRDGTLQGANNQLYGQCAEKFPGLKFQASGGVSGLGDIEQLAGTGADGVIIGKALLDGLFTVKEAIACSRGA